MVGFGGWNEAAALMCGCGINPGAPYRVDDHSLLIKMLAVILSHPRAARIPTSHAICQTGRKDEFARDAVSRN